MANSQFQQFFLIFFESLGLNWRKIDNRIKVRIWVLNQIIVIVITIFLLLQPKSTAITTHDSTSHWWRWLQHFTSCNARASYFSSSVPMSEKNSITADVLSFVCKDLCHLRRLQVQGCASGPGLGVSCSEVWADLQCCHVIDRVVISICVSREHNTCVVRSKET